MIDEIQNLMEEYWKWLRDKTALRHEGDCVEITTPHLDRHNDYLQIYVRRDNGGGFVITDDGYTLDDLEMCGCSINSERRREILETTLNGFGVDQNGNALEVKSSAGDFCVRKHNLVQAMLAVGDLFYTARSATVGLFNEDVARWMDSAEIRYASRIKFSGKSKFDHLFDFVIPKSKGMPERMLRAINHPSRDSAQTAIFAWQDIQESRPPASRFYAFMNDEDKSNELAVTDTSLDNIQSAMTNYGIIPVMWSGRENFLSDLVA